MVLIEVLQNIFNNNNISDMLMKKPIAIRMCFTLPRVTDKIEYRSEMIKFVAFSLL